MNHPTCQVLKPTLTGEMKECGNLAHLVRYNKTNKLPVYRTFRDFKDERKYICYECHKNRTPKLKYKDNIRRGKGYKNSRKDYCENIDGRLGFECTATIIDPECQLGVDHIDGDRENNDPHNHQTLCHNCHAYKTKINRDSGVKKSHIPTSTVELELC